MKKTFYLDDALLEEARAACGLPPIRTRSGKGWKVWCETQLISG
jgi:hypothetical protein